MGVQRWLVASALCVAVRGESVPLWHCPRWGHPRAGSWGHPGRSRPPPHAALLGTQGRQAGEVVSCLSGPQICSVSKIKESWGEGEAKKGGTGHALRAWRGWGGGENKAKSSQMGFNLCTSPSCFPGFAACKEQAGKPGRLSPEAAGGDEGGGGDHAPAGPPFLGGCKAQQGYGVAGTIVAPPALGTVCGCPDSGCDRHPWDGLGYRQQGLPVPACPSFRVQK